MFLLKSVKRNNNCLPQNILKSRSTKLKDQSQSGILLIKNNIDGFGNSVIKTYSLAVILHSCPADIADISLMFPKIPWVSRVESPSALSNRIQSKLSVPAEV